MNDRLRRELHKARQKIRHNHEVTPSAAALSVLSLMACVCAEQDFTGLLEMRVVSATLGDHVPARHKCVSCCPSAFTADESMSATV